MMSSPNETAARLEDCKINSRVAGGRSKHDEFSNHDFCVAGSAHGRAYYLLVFHSCCELLGHICCKRILMSFICIRLGHHAYLVMTGKWYAHPRPVPL